MPFNFLRAAGALALIALLAPAFTAAATLRLALSDDATTLDPHVANLAINNRLLNNIYEGLVRRDKDFQSLQENLAQAQEMRKNNVISLNEVVRRKEREMQEKRLAAMKGATGGAFADDGLQANERNLGKSLAAEKTQDSAKDILRNEAVSILADVLAFKQGTTQVANNALPTGPVLVMELPAVTRSR